MRAAAVGAVLAIALLGAWLVQAAPAKATARYDAQTAPLVLKAATTLFDQFGYSPDYVRNVPSFDSHDRPFIRSRGADLNRTGFVQELMTPANGTPYWQSFSFLAALRAVYPTYASVYYGAGWWTDRVIFDTSDRAYTVVSVQMPNQSLKNALLFSTDSCRTWRGVALPDGQIAAECFTGHNQIDGPPFLGIFVKSGYMQTKQSNIYTLLVTQPRWSGDSIVVPAPVTVSTTTFGWSEHSGGASFAASHYSVAAGHVLTHFIWGEVTKDALPGSPMYAATYDPATGQVTPKVLLGYATPINDVHCTPGITVDSQGFLHVVFGSHQQPFQYTCSMTPDSVNGGWTAPVDVLHSGYVSDPVMDPEGDGEQTYIALVCGPDDTLHLAFRQYRKGVDPYFGGAGYMALSYMRKPAGPPGQPWASDWEQPQVLAAPAFTGYAIWFQKLAIDHDGRLYLSASSLVGADKQHIRGQVRVWRLRGKVGPRPGYYLRRFVLTSADNGTSWHLATTADFTAGLGVAGVPAPATAVLPSMSSQAALGAAGAVQVAAHAVTRAGTALSTGTAGWQWRNRLPQGNALGGVDFVDAKHGVAVGDAGTILLTKDGGASWHAKVSSSRASLFSVDLVDQKHGWAVGDVDPRTGASTILRTQNGGSAWARQKAPVAVPLFGVAFADPKRGFAVGDTGTILVTNNGGATWKAQVSHTTNTLYSVTALDAADAWAAGENGVVLRTVDGGRHWVILRPKGQQPPEEDSRLNPAASTSAAGTTTSTATASGATASTATAHKAGALRVADKYAQRTTGAATREFDYGELYSVDFVSRTLGWAVGEAGGVFVSRDGGKTWSRQKVATTQNLTSVRFVTLKTGWMTGLNGTLMYTVDQGHKWTTVKTPALGLYAMTRLDAETGWAVGEDGQMLRLGAAKKAPKQVAKGFSTDLYGASISGKDGLVVGAAGTVLRSTDGGSSLTWQKPPVKATLRAVDVSSATRAVAVGDDGTIIASANGGAAWTARASPVKAELRAVDLAGAGGWAVGAGGTVLRTTDTGASWQAQAAGTSEDLSAVVALSDTQAWVGGGDEWGDLDAVLLHTVDGGVTWSSTRLVDASGSAVRGEIGALCASAGKVWAGGSDWAPDDDVPTGFVARSTDGGATWQIVSLSGMSRVRAVACSPSGAVWAVGDSGAAFRSTDGGATWTDVRTGVGQDLRAAVFTDQTHGWLFGAGGAMLSTQKGGV